MPNLKKKKKLFTKPKSLVNPSFTTKLLNFIQLFSVTKAYIILVESMKFSRGFSCRFKFIFKYILVLE